MVTLTDNVATMGGHVYEVHDIIAPLSHAPQSFDANFTPSPVTTPEPSTLLLVGTGLTGLAGVVRRKTWRRYGLGAVLCLATFGLLWAPPASATVIETIVWNGHRYYLISENTATNAELEAVSLGGHLATINSQAEQEFVWSTWGGKRGTGLGLWIGLNDLASEGTFGWRIAEPVTYTNWRPGEPNNGRGWYEEDFVNMDSRYGPSGLWNDVPDAGPGWNPARGVVELAHAPEPTTLLLVGSGSAAGLFLRRRRRS